MFKLNTKSLFTKLVIIIPFTTIIFWIILFIIAGHYLKENIERSFTISNSKILDGISHQSVSDLKFYDIYQLRRTLHDFYNAAYMDYFALYTVDMKPFAMYPATQFSSSDLDFIETRVKENSELKDSNRFFAALGHRRFHFQQQVKDENGQVLGYLFMGGRTAWLDKMANQQILYFVLLGFLVLVFEISVLIYFANRFTKPITQLTHTLKLIHCKNPEEVIPTVLAQPALIGTCSEVEEFDSFVRKILERIKEYQQKEMDLSVQATLGRVASHFAHDIKTPLSTLKNYLKIYKPAPDGDKEDIEKFEGVQRQLNKIDEMADELKSYTKAREIFSKRSNINALLGEVIADVAVYSEPKKTKINIETTSSIIANVDEGKLLRVLNNMVLNSIQAIPGLEGVVGIKAETKDKNLIIAVTDNGNGIAKEHLTRVFDSSFTHGKLKGTGLGLAYCKHVVEAHGGTITVQSTVGKGATFEITIPNAVEKEIPLNTPAAKDRPREQKEKSDAPICLASSQWIIVEDTEEFRNQWKEIFTRNKLPTPIEFILPELAVNANIDWKKVGGAIVDLNYVGSVMDGFDLIQWLIPKGLKTIYLCTSDHSEEKVQRNAKRLNITSVIPKPIPDNIDDPKSGIFRLS